MLQMPQMKRRKKIQKGSFRSIAKRGCFVSMGTFGMQALGRAWITNREIEAARIAINRSIKKNGTIWIRIFSDKPITKKPAEVRMGKGKGAFHAWVAVVEPGRILFEVGGNITEEMARQAFRKADAKLRVRTRFVKHMPMAY